MKTLKYEEIYRGDYRDLAQTHTGIARFLEKMYNHRRLHSALGYRPPAAFQRLLRQHRWPPCRQPWLRPPRSWREEFSEAGGKSNA